MSGSETCAESAGEQAQPVEDDENAEEEAEVDEGVEAEVEQALANDSVQAAKLPKITAEKAIKAIKRKKVRFCSHIVTLPLLGNHRHGRVRVLPPVLAARFSRVLCSCRRQLSSFKGKLQVLVRM